MTHSHFDPALYNQFKQALRCINVGTWSWNIQTGETVFDERWANLIGYTLEELQPVSIQTWIDLTHPKDYERSQRELQRHFDGEVEFYEMQARMKHKDGHWVWVLDRGQVLSHDEQGRPLMMVGAHFELSSFKQEELNRLSDQFHMIIENAPFPIIITNKADASLRYVNQRAIDQFNVKVTPDHALKISDFYLDLADRADLMARLNQDGFVDDMEIQLFDGNHRPFWALISAMWVDYEDEPSVLIAINDISRHKNIESELKSEKDKYRLLADEMADVIWIYNLAQNRFTYISPSVTMLRGYTVEEALQQRFDETMSQEAMMKLLKEFQGRLNQFLKDPEHQSPMIHELQQYRKDGSLVWVEMSSRFRVNSQGETEVISTSRNIDARKHMESSLDYLNLHDPLTGLLNKTALRLRMEQEKDHALVDKAFIHIDMDNFGSINDRLGHQKGDEILIDLSKKIQQQTGFGATVYHYDSDEFIVLAEFSDPDQVHAMAKAISQTVTQQLLINGQIFLLTASIGYDCADGKKSIETLFSNSTVAMFLAKRIHNAIMPYHDDMSEAKLRETRLENDLRFALERQQLELYYQPIYHVQSGKIKEAEALLRWHHPDLGLISPAEFIPIAEKTRLIVPITDWVIHEACAQLSRHNLGEDAFSLSINISFVTLANRSEDLFEHLSHEIRHHGIDPATLKLEVTESSLVQDATEVIRVFIRLKELGLRLALDDFGTGYSSFGYLKALPLDIVKIDRSLIMALETDSKAQLIVQSMITVLHGLGLKVVIEGVETQRQLDLLRTMKADLIQGYLLSKPLPEAKFISYMDHFRQEPNIDFDYASLNLTQIILHWKPEWDCGEPIIDDQHHELMNLGAQLEEMSSSLSLDPIRFEQQIINLIDKIEVHFSDEEAVLRQHHYPDLSEHQYEHSRLIDQSKALLKSYQAKLLDPYAFVTFVVREVLFDHILRDDILYFPTLVPLQAQEAINYIPETTSFRYDLDMKPYRVILSENMAFQSLITDISRSFIHVTLSDIDDKIDRALRQCGQHVHADRAYLFTYDWSRSVCTNTHEWCGMGIEPQIAQLQKFPLETIPDWVHAHLMGETINIPDVLALDPQSNLRQILEPQSIQSLLTVPMMADNVCYGFIGFDSVLHKHQYSEYERMMLKEVSNILLTALKRKTVEEQLVHEKDLYQLTLSILGEAIIILDDQLRLVSANPSSETLLGQKLLDRRGEPIQNLFKPTDLIQQKPLELDWDSLFEQTELSLPDNAGIQHVSGKTVFIAGKIKGLYDRQGQPSGALIRFSDITLQYETNKQIEAFLNVNLDMLVVADLQGYFVKVNQKLADVLGYDLNELEGRRFLDLVHPDDVSKTVELLKDLPKLQVAKNFTNRYLTKQGHYRYIEWQAQLGYGHFLYASARDITERILKEESSIYHSTHDGLTGLVNRRFMEEKMKQAESDPGLHPISVVMIDIDRLKETNDSKGHFEGDVLIQAVSDRLKGRCRPDDWVGRWGGDEFMILLMNTPAEQAERIAQRLGEPDSSLAEISVGYAIKQTISDAFPDVLRLADQRMNEHKRRHHQTHKK